MRVCVCVCVYVCVCVCVCVYVFMPAYFILSILRMRWTCGSFSVGFIYCPVELLSRHRHASAYASSNCLFKIMWLHMYINRHSYAAGKSSSPADVAVHCVAHHSLVVHLHTSAYVSIRQYTSAYDSIRQHMQYMASHTTVSLFTNIA
jgi:hypothetical protein